MRSADNLLIVIAVLLVDPSVVFIFHLLQFLL